MFARADLTRLAIFLLVCCRVGNAADDFLSGVCIHVGHNQNPPAATAAALAPFNSFRDEVSWARSETSPARLSFPDSLRDLDELVTHSVAQGKQPLLILDYGNEFHDGGDLPASVEAVAAYARYARFVVHHFKGRVSRYEVWNEWNIGMGSPSHPRPRGPPADYVALLEAAYKTIKIEDSNAVVIGGAVSGTDDAWVDSFGRHGGFAYLDAFSVHPYVYGAPAPRNTPEAAIQWLDAMKTRADRFAGRNVPIYVTEIGWPTHQGPHGVSEATAAAFAQRFVLLAHARPWIAGVWWYDLFDDGGDPSDKESRFGLLHTDGSPKSAYQSMVAVQSSVRSPTPLSVGH
jgi:hypothetical protein